MVDIQMMDDGLDADSPKQITKTSTVFQQHLDRATKIVESWPTWKQNILANCGKPTCPPRPFVDNKHDDNYI